MAKKDDKIFKNRHVSHKNDEESELYVFPETDNPTKRFCTVEDVLAEFKPIMYLDKGLKKKK